MLCHHGNMAAQRESHRVSNEGPTRERLIDAAIAVLAQDGPGEMKVRRISDEAGVSTITVYHHFGGVRGLLDAVVSRGYAALRTALIDAAASDADPGVQLFSMALSTRSMARRNPHLYDMMFGLSQRATYRATAPAVPQDHFRESFAVVIDACDRLVRSGRVDIEDPEQIAAQLWSLVHGFVSLEAAGHFASHTDAVADVLAPLAVAQLVGIGDARTRATRSALIAYDRYKADNDGVA